MDDEIQKFAKNHRELLTIEREENLQHLLQDLSSTNLRQMEKNGQVFTKLVINNIANKGPGQIQIDLGRPDELELEHGLSSGDLVFCLRQNKVKNAIRGVVTEVSDISISISVNDTVEDVQEEETFTLVKANSDTTYRYQTR